MSANILELELKALNSALKSMINIRFAIKVYARKGIMTFILRTVFQATALNLGSIT